jgi:hypothetical protein
MEGVARRLPARPPHLVYAKLYTIYAAILLEENPGAPLHGAFF